MDITVKIVCVPGGVQFSFVIPSIMLSAATAVGYSLAWRGRSLTWAGSPIVWGS